MVRFCGIYFHCPLRKHLRRLKRKLRGESTPAVREYSLDEVIPGASPFGKVVEGTTRIKVTLTPAANPSRPFDVGLPGVFYNYDGSRFTR